MNDEITKAKEILNTEYSELLKDTNYLDILSNIKICSDNQEYLQRRLDNNFLPPNSTSDEVIHNVLKSVITDVPNERVIEFTKNKVNNSFISKIIPKEKIEEAFANIYICKDKYEFKEIYGEDTDGIDGFNRAGISYLPNSCTPHAIIHELLHTFSSDFDENGHRIKNGLMGDECTYTTTMINEGATDYLAQTISHEYSGHYSVPRNFFTEISPLLNRYYNDENALFNLYTSKNDLEFKHFLDTVNKKTNSNELYSSYIMSNKEKLNDYINECKKGLKKIEKRRDFEIKHPKITKISQKIKSMFSKKQNEQKMLPKKSQNIPTNNNSFIPDLKDNVKNLDNIEYKDIYEKSKEIEKEEKIENLDTNSHILY